MFTQCSKCETVFRLSAEALRAAGGQVRCGRCGEVFNALSRLAEDSTGFSKGESSLDLETRADEILESEPPDQAQGLREPDPDEFQPADIDLEAPPGVDIAQLQFVDAPDDDLASETSLEFTLPPGELDRIFIETRPSRLQKLAAEGLAAQRIQSDASVLPAAPDSYADADLGEPRTIDATASSTPPAFAAAAATAADARAPTTFTTAANRSGSHPSSSRISGLEVSEGVRQEMLSSYAHAELPEINASRRRFPFTVWLAAALALALLLAVQVVRGSSDWFAAHVPFIGRSSSGAGNLASYQLRQWGVTGDPAAKGTLRVRASIMNTSGQLQPYPLLRVTLVNRFGTRVGAREFDAAEYRAKTTARMLAPGERVDATLDILDPGKDAEGFEIDVCVRGADKRVVCAADAAAQAK